MIKHIIFSLDRPTRRATGQTIRDIRSLLKSEGMHTIALFRSNAGIMGISLKVEVSTPDQVERVIELAEAFKQNTILMLDETGKGTQYSPFTGSSDYIGKLRRVTRWHASWLNSWTYDAKSDKFLSLI